MKRAHSPSRRRTGSTRPGTARTVGEVVDEPGWDFAQVFTGLRFGGKTKADPRGINGLQGLVDGCLVDLDGLAPGIEVFLADAAASNQFLPPLSKLLRASTRDALRLLSVATFTRSSAILVLTSSMERSSWNRCGTNQADGPAHLGIGRRKVCFGRSDCCVA